MIMKKLKNNTNRERGVTWLEFGQIYDPAITADEVIHLLWEGTAFPFINMRTTLKQLSGAVRAAKNNLHVCEFCGRKKGFCHCEDALGWSENFGS